MENRPSCPLLISLVKSLWGPLSWLLFLVLSLAFLFPQIVVAWDKDFGGSLSGTLLCFFPPKKFICRIDPKQDYVYFFCALGTGVNLVQRPLRGRRRKGEALLLHIWSQGAGFVYAGHYHLIKRVRKYTDNDR